MDNLANKIEGVLKERIEEIINEEAQKAKENVEQRINNMADVIALNILQDYRIETRQNEIIIRVDKTNE